MTPNEKAKELVDKFEAVTTDFELAKECAIIVVEEILSLRMIHHMGRGLDDPLNEGQYWEQVKEKIKQL